MYVTVVVHRLYSWVALLIAFSLAACIASSDTMKASLQGGGLKVSSILSSPSVSEMCGVFNNRDLLSNSGRQPRAMIIVYIA